MTFPHPLERVQELLQGEEWVKGAVNYDEDLHFSTFYLRASCAGETAPLYPGYSALVAFYTDCNETYYLLKRECRATAAAIVGKALRRPGWLQRVLAEIYRRSDLLAGLFPRDLSASRLRGLPDGGLLALLRRHARRQRYLYRVARLPEALDRGVSYFSGYLHAHLRSQSVPPDDVADAFAVLSQPLVPSALAQELLEFEEIVQAVQATPRAAETLTAHRSRAHLFLDPALRARLDAHREKWQFLHYHGYGRRELAAPRHYLDRLLERLRQPGARAAGLTARFEEGRREQQRLRERLRLDDAHRSLFEVYPEIGAAKLYRRHAQLRNFYYLDLLLAEIARRLDVTEWVVRCMLPEEVEAALEERRGVPPGVLERLAASAYLHVAGQEHVAGGAAALALARQFQEKTRAVSSGGVLTGVVACRGRVTAPCKVIIRADDLEGDFPDGAIVVSESTDPDLLGILARAGGVLTEQGGVTSHAAVICRELGIPTLIGVEGLLDRVRDGAVVALDAFRGTVTVLADGAQPADGALATDDAPDGVGAKAENLGLVRALGFHVPEFVVLPLETAHALLDSATEKAALQEIDSAVARLGLGAHETLAVRSSSAGEDRADGSQAGEFRSLLRVPRDGLAAALHAFVRGNRVGKRGNGYRGSVIVQRMIAAEFGGVCLTLDPRTGRDGAVILELVAGDNDGVTGGTAAPDRLVVDRLTGDVLEAQRRCPRLRAAAVDVAHLVQRFLTLEARFGKPVDIEWAWADGKLYILQTRPIVAGKAGC